MRVILIAAAVALSFLAAGCGNDDDAATTGSSEASGTVSSEGDSGSSASGAGGEGSVKAEFIKEANGICRRVTATIQTDGKRIFSEGVGGSEAEGEVLKRRIVDEVLVPGFKAEAAQLSALTPPPGDEQQVASIIAAIEEVIERVERNPDGRYPYSDAERLADRYGLDRCGGPAP